MKGRDLKPHIGIFGRRNHGKSSLINYLTGQITSIVADEPGTTTDPVKKSVEIFGVGPAIVVDTAGIDDSGTVGEMRIDKAFKIIPTIDVAILVIAENIFGHFEEELVKRFENYSVPFLVLHNKADLMALSPTLASELRQRYGVEVLDFSTTNPDYKEALIEILKTTIPKTAYAGVSLFKGIVKPKDVVLLVTPIDSEAPVGRMILPQVMAWRDILDNDCICMSVKESELEDFFKLGVKPSLVVTDSQAFEVVSGIVPANVRLTGFSVVFARFRGDFEKYLEGTPAIGTLQDGDRVLILESCTHQVSCDDIGRFKIPRWLMEFTGKKLQFEVVAGFSELHSELNRYKLVIQCGGCVVTAKQLKGRLKPFVEAGIPVTNYGLAIAYVNGIFDRVTEPFV